MRLWDYLNDHKISIGIFVGMAVIVEAILLLFKTAIELYIFLQVVLTGSGVVIVTYNYQRKKQYYQKIKEQLLQLDKKFLLIEMIEQPDFLEGSLFYQWMEQISKSMNDEIFSQVRKNKEFKQYIETWVHEIKLPITSLKLMIYNNKKDYPRALREQVRKIETYVEQVLYYIRSEVPQKDYVIKECCLKNIVDLVIKENKDSLILNQIKILQQVPECFVLTDEKWLSFMIGQIVSNSVKYRRKENPEILFTCIKIEHGLRFCIRDNGIGIALADLPRVFEKSFTGENGHKTAASTGLGLYLCNQMARELGHKITIDSKQNEYTEVRIDFDQDLYLTVAQ